MATILNPRSVTLIDKLFGCLLAVSLVAGCLAEAEAAEEPNAVQTMPVERTSHGLALAPAGARLQGFIDIDGNRQPVEGAAFQMQLARVSDSARGDGSPMGMTVTESISISDGVLTTKTTVTSADGKTTTTTTTTTNTNTQESTSKVVTERK